MTKATNQVETSGAEAIMCIFFPPKLLNQSLFFLFVPQIIVDRGSIQQVGSEHGRSARLFTHCG